jgi:hypothetical protein
MDNKSDNSPRVVRNAVMVLKVIPTPPGVHRRGTTMAKEERKAARRRWLLVSGAIAAALVLGVLIGRFLIP